MSELVFSQAYEHRDYDPPMPVLDIGVSRPGVNVPSATVDAVVDTGADGSLLPLDVLAQAGAIFVDRAYLRGITRQRQAVDLYLITIHLGRFRIPGIRAAARPPGEAACFSQPRNVPNVFARSSRHSRPSRISSQMARRVTRADTSWFFSRSCNAFRSALLQAWARSGRRTRAPAHRPRRARSARPGGGKAGAAAPPRARSSPGCARAG
jgi:hypothetical protein